MTYFSAFLYKMRVTVEYKIRNAKPGKFAWYSNPGGASTPSLTPTTPDYAYEKKRTGKHEKCIKKEVSPVGEITAVGYVRWEGFVEQPKIRFALPTDVFSSCLAIVSAVTVGGLFLWPTLRYGTCYQTVWETQPSAETPSDIHWRRFYFQLRPNLCT